VRQHGAHTPTRATFAAIVAHADDADMLVRCVRHHLAIGVDTVFISLNRDEPESTRAARELEHDGRVRAAHVESFAADPFHYFTAAKDVVAAWTAPDWVLFVDSDEFWIPRSGRIQATAGLEDADLFDVPVLQAPPIRERDGTFRTFDAEPDRTLIFAPRLVLSDVYLAEHPEATVVMDSQTKVLVRPAVVGEVGRGAHRIEPRVATLRRGEPADLAILHLPFTTHERFRRKVERVRARLTVYGDRFAPGQAWHWRRWIELDDTGRLDEEFDRQAFGAERVPELIARGVLTTPADFIAGVPAL
jgi:hypothetical protein